MLTGNTIATIFLSMSLVSLAGGMLRIENFGIPTWLFIIFFILFRIKMYLDDVLYFKDVDTKDWQFKYGFFFGIFSWFFWIASAVHLAELDKAFLFVLIAFVLSTIWILIAGFAEKFKKQHKVWLLTNSLYILFTLLTIAKLIKIHISAPILLCICLVDLWKSGSFKALEE